LNQESARFDPWSLFRGSGAPRSHTAQHIQICSVGSSLSCCEGFTETLLRSPQFKPKEHQCLHKFFLSLFR
jgi:hypothetical protein